MFGLGSKRNQPFYCSECGARMSRHVAGKCPSSVWDVPAEKLRAKQDADVAAAVKDAGFAPARDDVEAAMQADAFRPRKLYGGELLNDLHKRVVALEDKAVVKDVGFVAGQRTGRKDALDEVEAVVRNHMRNRSPSDPVFVVLCNVLHRMTEMAK